MIASSYIDILARWKICKSHYRNSGKFALLCSNCNCDNNDYQISYTFRSHSFSRWSRDKYCLVETK